MRPEGPTEGKETEKLGNIIPRGEVFTNVQVAEGLSEIEEATVGKELEEREKIPEKSMDEVLKGIAEKSGLKNHQDLQGEISERQLLVQKIIEKYSGFRPTSFSDVIKSDTIINSPDIEFPRNTINAILNDLKEKMALDSEFIDFANKFIIRDIYEISILENKFNNKSFLVFEIKITGKDTKYKKISFKFYDADHLIIDWFVS